MNRLVLRLLNTPALILLAAIGVAVQTSLFTFPPLVYFQPDIVLIIVIWCALKRSFTEGGIITLIVANIAELHSASPQGMFLILYMGIYLLVRGTSRLFVIPNRSTLLLLTIGAVAVLKFGGVFVLKSLGVTSGPWRHAFVYLLPAASAECLLAAYAYRWLEKFDWMTFKNARAEQALEDELQLETEGY